MHIRKKNQKSYSALNHSASLQSCQQQMYITARTANDRILLLPPLSLQLLLFYTSFLLFLGPLYGGAYNIDIPSFTRHQREPNTMFGFSIAFHKGRSGYPQTNSLVVGAPKFDTSSFQKGVVEAGAVFKCGMTDGDCTLVKFDSSENNRNTQGEVIDRKSYQWLGATVVTSRDNDLIVACAPRYVFHTMTPTKNLRHDPVGTCFTSRNFTHFKEVSPCRTNFFGYHRQGFCQAGFSAAASGRGDRLYVGAPGSWYWQGQVYSISPDATFPYKPDFYKPFGTGGQTYSYDVTRPENQVFSTTESTPKDDDSYLGYSMTTGDFNGDRIDDVAIGMPRGAGLLGKIVVNGWNMINIFNITGRQIGEYFGYSLASSDVDGDGLDDLIIGAPMYSEPGNAEGKYDVGRVYILLQTGTDERNRWTVEHIRDGYNTKGRFGLALASLGDVNRDGYGDFAVGAPYDGPNGLGVVYIFHGSPSGPLQKPSQIIKAEEVAESAAPYPRTFGFALTGGLDMDGNTYPDMAVGAYASDQVFIFKSRPVAAVNAMTSFLNPSKLINLEEKNCRTVRDGKNVVCTDIMTCWSYTGEYLPSALEFDVSWVLDAKKPKNPRMFFLQDEGKNIRNLSITLPFGKTFCRNETVYLIENVQDKLTPLEVETRYNLRSNRYSTAASSVRRRRDALEPVIDENREIVQRDAINIQKNCGSDNICEPDLKLEIRTVDKYLLGSREPLSIEVFIANMNEDAFEAAFYMIMPKDLDFKKIQQIGDKTDTPITCTAPSEVNNYTLKCDIGNPLPAKKFANFKVVMLPSHKVGMAPSYDFFMEANSTNVEKVGSHFDNIISKSISIWVETDLAIDGTSLPDFQLYKASEYKSVENATKEDDLGPQVVHLYNVFNKGPSTIEEAVIFIHYPYQTEAGDVLMYMTNQPETDGNIVCDPHVNVNALNLQLDQNLVRKSYLEQSGAVVRTHGLSSVGGSGGGFIEKSDGQRGSSTSVTIGQDTRTWSVEEKKRLEKEQEQGASGDASFIHSQRANAAAQASRQGGAQSGDSWTWSSSWNSSSTGQGQGQGLSPSMIVSSRNTSVYYDQYGRPHVVESSTEYLTNVDHSVRTFHHQPQSFTHNREGNIHVPPPVSAHTEQTMTAHNARGHIQMANPGGSLYRQRTYSTTSNQGSSPSSPGNVRVGSSATYNDLSLGNNNLEKIAQGGRGFQTNALDLGTLNRANVDEDLRSRSSSDPHYTYTRFGTAPQTSHTYQQQSGRSGGGSYSEPKDSNYVYNQTYVRHGTAPQQQGSTSYQHTYSSHVPTYNHTYVRVGSVPQQQQHGTSHSYVVPAGSYVYNQSYMRSGSGVPQHSSSSSSARYSVGSKPYLDIEDYYDDGDGVANAHDSQQWTRTFPSSSMPHKRVRREGMEATQIDLNSPCRTTRCETIRCVARHLGKDDNVWIAIRTRMVAKTMEKLAGSVALNVSTMAVSHVTRLPYIGQPKDDIIRTHEIFYKAVPEPTPVPDVVPLWVVVLAACAGALILLLLIFLLYKCGFFKRNRPTNHSVEHQPLRNGYHGDEHL